MWAHAFPHHQGKGRRGHGHWLRPWETDLAWYLLLAVLCGLLVWVFAIT